MHGLTQPTKRSYVAHAHKSGKYNGKHEIK